MSFRLAINGYGRIGQCVLRALYERGFRDSGDDNGMQVVAINELSDVDTIAYLTRYDTTHGRFPGQVQAETNVAGGASCCQLRVNEDCIALTHEQDIQQLDWHPYNVDLLLECTGVYGTAETARQHIRAGAGRVLFSHPADHEVDKLVVYGLNHQRLGASDYIVSNASCTTNSIVPVIQALDEAFGIEQGTLTTIHSMMNDQPTIDAYHHQDLRRTRSAMHNLVPVNTGLAKGVERLLPQMAGKFTAVALRVPVINVSAIDLTVRVAAETSEQQVNQVLQQAADSRFDGVLAYTEEPVASSDFNHDPHSGIVDGSQTRVSGGRMIKVLVWFDNEWGFANRMLDVAHYWMMAVKQQSAGKA